jgi:hypothetical protein
VVDDEAVETAKGGDGGGDEGAAVLRRGELLADGVAVIGAAALCGECLGLSGGRLIAEDYVRASLAEEANSGRTNSAGASGDEGNFARQRHYDTKVVRIRHILDAIESTFWTQVTPVLRVTNSFEELTAYEDRRSNRPHIAWTRLSRFRA